MEALAEEQSRVPQLLAQLQTEREARERLESVLALRNGALDSATTHFMITDRARGGAIV
jgi:hypothetical protein